MEVARMITEVFTKNPKGGVVMARGYAVDHRAEFGESEPL